MSDTGLVYMYQRWYNPETGAFLSKAPYPPEMEDQYAFATQHPILFVDPEGEFAEAIRAWRCKKAKEKRAKLIDEFKKKQADYEYWNRRCEEDMVNLELCERSTLMGGRVFEILTGAARGSSTAGIPASCLMRDKLSDEKVGIGAKIAAASAKMGLLCAPKSPKGKPKPTPKPPR